MTPDAALDQVAFLVGLRLMGPDARRHLRLSLAKEIASSGKDPGLNVEALERLNALIHGEREPETLQDRMDLARAKREQSAPPFEPGFWLTRASELISAGFTAQQAAQIIAEVRCRVDPLHSPVGIQMEELYDSQSQA